MAAASVHSTSGSQGVPQPTQTWQSRAWDILKKIKKISIIAIKVIVLVGLCLFQGPTFGLGFGIGFVLKCALKDECTEAMKRIQEAITNRPLLFLGIVVGFSIIVPEWLLVGPSFIGGVYGGIKFAEICQKVKGS